MQEIEQKRPSTTMAALYGASAGIATRIVVAPLESINKLSVMYPGVAPHKLAAEAGIASLYSFSFISSIKYTVFSSSIFGFHNFFTKKLYPLRRFLVPELPTLDDQGNSKGEVTWKDVAMVHAISGGLAGAATQTLVYPYDTVPILYFNHMREQILKQANAQNAEGAAGAEAASAAKISEVELGKGVKDFLKKEGIMSIYRGVGLAYLSAVVFRSTFFGLYETLKHLHFASRGDTHLSNANMLQFAFIASLAASIVNNPLDIARRIYLQSTMLTPIAAGERYAPTIIPAVLKGGVRIFIPNFMYVLQGVLSMVAYEKIVQFASDKI